MNYTPTQQQLEHRQHLRDLIADTRNVAEVVRQQPNLTRRQRDAVQVLSVVAGRVAIEFSDEPKPTVFERLILAMEE